MKNIRILLLLTAVIVCLEVNAQMTFTFTGGLKVEETALADGSGSTGTFTPRHGTTIPITKAERQRLLNKYSLLPT